MKPVAKKAMTNAPPAEPIVELTAFRIASSRSFAAESWSKLSATALDVFSLEASFASARGVKTARL